jgi:hypothetical protein
MTTEKIERARRILLAEADTRRALKVARARRFLAEVKAGTRVTDAWQIVQLDTAELEAAYERARVEATLLRLECGQAPEADEQEAA